jgi:hypothetical protein
MTDGEFLAAVQVGEEPSEHVANLRLAWLLLLRHDPAEVEGELALALSRRARRTGGRVHQTRTAAWLAVVRAAAQDVPDVRVFDDLLVRRRELLDRHLLHRYYEPTTLADPLAAVTVLPPDRAPMPGLRVLVAG